MASVTITGFGLQTGTDRTVYVTWDCTLSHVDHYLATWHYDTGDGIGYEGGSEEIKQDVWSDKKQATYTAPSNATIVHGWVKPVSTTHKVNGKDTSYWTGSWAYTGKYYFSWNPPTTPGAPSIEVGDEANGDSKYKITLRITDIEPSDNTDYMHFGIYKNKSDGSTSSVASIYAQKVNRTCTAYAYVAAGATYRGVARAVNSLDSGTKTKVTLVDGTTATLYSPVYSGWGPYSSEVSPPPDAPSNLKASANDVENGTGSVKLTWSKGSGAEGYEVGYSKKKEYVESTSGDFSTDTVDTDVTSCYVTGLDPGEEWFFKLRATNSTGNSAWTSIVSVIIGTTPEAPTTWSSTTTAMIGDIVNLYWVHNCEDNSDQTAAEIYLQSNTSEDEIVTITDDTREYALDTGKYDDGTEITWKVRTAGITKNYGEYSTTRKIKINSPAMIDLDMPEVIDSFPFTIIATVSPSTQKAISYYISICATESYETYNPNGESVYIKEGEEIYSKLYNTTLRTTETVLITLSVGDLTLQDGITYRATVTAAMDTGLSTENYIDFTVSWAKVLYTPDASIGINFDNLCAYIQPYCEELVDYEEGQNIDEAPRELVQGITLAVYRRESDGTFTLIGDQIENDKISTIVDPHPALDYARYRIVAQDDATGQISYEDIPGISVDQPYIVIQWDEEWSDFDYYGPDELSDKEWNGSMIKIKGNVDVSESTNPDKALIEYAGRSYPVSYYGTQIGESGTWNVDIPKDDAETIYQLRRLEKYMGDVYVREPSGMGFWAQLNVSMNTEHCKTVVPVTLTIDRVEGGV